MNSPKEEDILIINPSIHKTTKLSRKQFLDKVSFVKAIRTIENNTYLTIYPYDYNEYLLIEQFHDLINKGDFSFFSEEQKKGFIYVIRRGDTSEYKIGWTADHDINKRCKSLQTGSPEILTVRGHFPTSSQKTEKVIHNIFKKQHISGEWFYLTEDQVVNLLNPYWRQKNNIY